MALLLSDMFDGTVAGDNSNNNDNLHKNYLSNTLDEVVKGALSYNGQRCTALKLVVAPKGQGEHVAKELATRVENMRIGFPWETATNGLYSQITPLPNQQRVAFMQHLIKDAVSKGASIQNEHGGRVIREGERFDRGAIIRTTDEAGEGGGTSVTTTSNLMVPAVLYPVTPDMDIYKEEQFGPIVPVAEYDADLKNVIQFGQEGVFGQQVSIFTSSGAGGDAALLVDQFSAVFGKININSQCGRSPDTVPFSARKASGMGVMSVEEALREFSIPTVVTYKDDGKGSVGRIVDTIRENSQFMRSARD